MPVTFKLRDIGVLRARDMPEVKVILVEEPEPEGPFGAKGVGEIGLVPTAGAVAGALEAFDGIRRYRLPMKDSPAAKAMSVGRPSEGIAACGPDSSTRTRTSTAGWRRWGCRSPASPRRRVPPDARTRLVAASTARWTRHSLRASARFYVSRALLAGTSGSSTTTSRRTSSRARSTCWPTPARTSGCEPCCAMGRPNATADEAEAASWARRMPRGSSATIAARWCGAWSASTRRSPSRTRPFARRGSLCRELGTVMHVHLAEDAADVADASGVVTLARWNGCWRWTRCLPGRSSRTVCTWSPIKCARRPTAAAGSFRTRGRTGTTASAMRGALRHAQRVGLGTDGFPADMLDECDALAEWRGRTATTERRGAQLPAGGTLLASFFGDPAGDERMPGDPRRRAGAGVRRAAAGRVEGARRRGRPIDRRPRGVEIGRRTHAATIGLSEPRRAL